MTTRLFSIPMNRKPGIIFLFLPVLCWFVNTVAVAADGDINIDGEVNSVDILWGQQTMLGIRSLSPDQFSQGNIAPLVSGIPQPDDVFNLGDFLVITRIALGMLNYSIPVNQFNIGDSIGEGEAADGTIGEAHHETVWSTGYNGSDSVNSFNEQFETALPENYYENNVSRDPVFNHAVSGSVMADFAEQAQNIVTASAQTPADQAGLITVFLGNNDVCASSLQAMTDPSLFESQYRAGLDALTADDSTRKAQIHVSGIPAIYWLWNAKHNVFWCRVFAWPFVPCENLLDNAADDCENSASREDPDIIYPGDGTNCQRRKNFHRIIRDTYNPILRDVLTEYRIDGSLPNARYTDIYDIRFESTHVNGGDCFHPSIEGQALLAEKEWCKTHWGNNNPACNN